MFKVFLSRDGYLKRKYVMTCKLEETVKAYIEHIKQFNEFNAKVWKGQHAYVPFMVDVEQTD